MLVVVSPAKRLDETPATGPMGTTPVFADAAAQLANIAKNLSGEDLEKLMHISPKLGALNQERFAAFGSGAGEKPAVQMFSGDTYAGFEAGSLEPAEIAYAQQHFRILSGLYGLLRPLDIIQPHRLEMGTRLVNPEGRNLYEFWGDRIALELNAAAQGTGSKVLVNCASVEYFKAIDPQALALRIVTPVFMEDREGGPKVMAFFAKKARGAMARFIVQKRVEDIEGLKDFDTGGYHFQGDLSTPDKLVFLR